jgi:outer membrane protein OmpA-like peptidoglycan-associated protein
MDSKHAAALVTPILAAAVACAGERLPPKALLDARADYVRAKEGMAMQLDPTAVHEADVALQKAERAWERSPDEPSAVDLATIADRVALIAQSEAATIEWQQDTQQVLASLEAMKSSQLRSTRGEFTQAHQALGVTQMQLQQRASAATARQQKLRELEEKLKDARDTIAKIAAVTDDDRGMVITLESEVLFKTGEWDLKPGAMAKLDPIAEALKGGEQPIAIYGYTDAVGARDKNMALSQMRARSVRVYLVSRGVSEALVMEQGKGPDEPVADNGSVEGRARNRRVEIVVQPKSEKPIPVRGRPDE